MSNNNQCAACGQWAGRGHRCPTPTGQANQRRLKPARKATGPAASEVNARVAAAQAHLASGTVLTAPRIGDPSTECDCGDCEYVGTDCCGDPRPDCETATGPDGDDGTLRVCMIGNGCAPTEEEHYAEMYAQEAEYMSSPEGQRVMLALIQADEDEYAASQPAIPLTQPPTTPVDARPTPELWDAVRVAATTLRDQEAEANDEHRRALNAYTRAKTPDQRARARERIDAAEDRINTISETGNNGVWIVGKQHNLTPEWKARSWENAAESLPAEHQPLARAIAARIRAEAANGPA